MYVHALSIAENCSEKNGFELFLLQLVPVSPTLTGNLQKTEFG